MAFRYVGYFRELFDDEPTLPSIRSALRDIAHPHEEQIVEYLRIGVALAGIGRYVEDVLNPNARIPSLTPSPRTDGVWVWREDLSYYVATYHVELPAEFMLHMQQNSWVIPAICEQRRAELRLQLYREMNNENS